VSPVPPMVPVGSFEFINFKTCFVKIKFEFLILKLICIFINIFYSLG
jgi:hypothetical protein